MDAIIKLLQQNVEKYQPKKVSIFGSYATQTNQSHSDLDLLVEFDKSKKYTLFDLIRMENELSEVTGKKVDLVTVESLSKYIKPYIEKQSIVIYEK